MRGIGFQRVLADAWDRLSACHRRCKRDVALQRFMLHHRQDAYATKTLNGSVFNRVGIAPRVTYTSAARWARG